MRLVHRDGTVVHLAYCTNVHPAEDLEGVIAQLTRYGSRVRARLGVDVIGLGLWLARDVAAQLSGDVTELVRLRRFLHDRGLEVVTLNGFPYGGFHDEVVKRRAYLPDWAKPERYRYTLDLARILTYLLPDDVARGSITTLPLAWRTDWPPALAAVAARRLERLARELRSLAVRTGRVIRIGFEPEPGCVIETSEQAAKLLSSVDHTYFGICLDTCHLAVGFESPALALDRLAAAGLDVIKLQASCALEAAHPSDPLVRRALRRFAEPRFLHQVREPSPDGVLAADDLDEALAGRLPGDGPWRVNFHVPLHVTPADPLETTRPFLEEALSSFFGGPSALTDHVEVETYTWDVLPGDQRPTGVQGLVAGIAGELDWTRQRLTSLGLASLS